MSEFSVDYSSIDKADTLNIRKYLMTKNSMSSLIKQVFIVLLNISECLATKHLH